MNYEQSTRIAVAFARQTANARRSGLAAVCVDMLSVAGAGVSVMGGGRSGSISVCGAGVAALEDAQFAIGVGPCQEAFQSGRPVHAPDLAGSSTSRWPSLVDVARSNGLGAAFAYPLGCSGTTIGVMSLYLTEAGDLSKAQHDDSLAVAEVLTAMLLSMQDPASDEALGIRLDEAVAYRAQIYQASGMVAVQLGISAPDAMLRVRAHAYANDQPLGVLAAEIVGRRIRLTDDRDQSQTDVSEQGG